MNAEYRASPRHDLGSFVGPHTRKGVNQGFLVANLSAGGMGVLRLRPGRFTDADMDRDHGWYAIPLPALNEHLTAYAQVVHRRTFGPMEALGLRFRFVTPFDLVKLETYLKTQSVPSPEAISLD